MATPHMSDLMNLDLTFNVYTSSEASLLALPNTVLQRILEYSETVRSQANFETSLLSLAVHPLGHPTKYFSFFKT